MKIKVYAIRDVKIGAFQNTFLKPTDIEAERDFTSAVNDPRTTLNRYPDDFELWYIAEYTDDTGMYENDTHRKVVGANQVKNKDPQIVMDLKPEEKKNV